jgi:hypothetical protein
VVHQHTVTYDIRRSTVVPNSQSAPGRMVLRPGLIYAFTRSVHLSASVAHVKLNFTCGTEQVLVFSTSRDEVFTVIILIRILALLTWMLMELMKKTLIVVMMIV